jgi:tRNA pseudouridine(38-40) synthase
VHASAQVCNFKTDIDLKLACKLDSSFNLKGILDSDLKLDSSTANLEPELSSNLNPRVAKFESGSDLKLDPSIIKEFNLNTLANSVKQPQLAPKNYSKHLISLNGILADDLKISNIEQVPLNFNARFSAKARTYEYRAYARPIKPVLASPNTAWLKQTLDISILNQRIHELKALKEFENYTKASEPYDHYRCDIKLFKVEQVSPELYIFKISANRFLRHMVRKLIGELILICRGFTVEQAIKKSYSAPAEGLTLVEVVY